MFVNLAFKQWLRSLIGPERYRKIDPTKSSNRISSRDAESETMRTHMIEFENKKKAFKGPESRKMHFDLPEIFHDLRVDGRIKECQITISRRVFSVVKSWA